MKKSKILTLTLAMVMAFTMLLPLTAFAAPKSVTLTIQPADNATLTASQIKVYQLYEYDWDTKIYTETANVASFLTWAAANAIGAADYPATAAGFLAFLNQIQADLIDTNPATRLAAQVRLETLNADMRLAAEDGELAATGTPVQAGKFVKVPLNTGYYVVTAKVGTTENIGFSNLVALTGETGTDVIKLKDAGPGLDKKGEVDGDNNMVKQVDASVGDRINFQLESKVPDLRGYREYTFTVTDTMSAGLTFDPDSIVIQVGTETLDSSLVRVPVAPRDSTWESGDYTVTYDPPLPVGEGTQLKFTIEIKDLLGICGIDNATIARDAQILITYSATLNKFAVTTDEGMAINKANLTYSNDPRNGSKTITTPDTQATVCTFGFLIEKKDGNNTQATSDDKPLDGVGFQVTAKGAAQPLWFLWDAAANKYIVCRNDNPADGNIANAVQTIYSRDGGLLNIHGLDAGEYTMTEVYPHPGYNPAPDLHFLIVHGDPHDADPHDLDDNCAWEIQIDGNINGTFNEMNPDNRYETKLPGFADYVLIGYREGTKLGGTGKIIIINNKQEEELPGTGGIGTYIFFGTGAALAILLFAGFVVYRRKKTLGALKG